MSKSEQTVEEHKRCIIAYKGHLTCAFKYCKDETDKTTSDAISLQFCINKINNAWANYDSAFHDYEIVTDLDESTYGIYSDLEVQYQNCVFNLQTLLQSTQTVLQSTQSILQSNPENASVQPTNPELAPKHKGIHLEVPKFSGDRKGWPVF